MIQRKLITIPQMKHFMVESKDNYFDYSQRAQWLRAIVLGGIEGLAYTTIVMMGVEMATHDYRENKIMLLTVAVTLIAGAMRIATSEYISVYTQIDTMTFQAKRDMKTFGATKSMLLPKASEIAVAASLAYLAWGAVPLLAAGFIMKKNLKCYVGLVASLLSILVLGVIGAALGKTPILRSCVRVLVGGFIATLIMWGKVKILRYMLGALIK